MCRYSTYRVCFLFIVVKVAIEDFDKQLHLRSGVHALVTDSNSFLQALSYSFTVPTLKQYNIIKINKLIHGEKQSYSSPGDSKLLIILVKLFRYVDCLLPS